MVADTEQEQSAEGGDRTGETAVHNRYIEASSHGSAYGAQHGNVYVYGAAAGLVAVKLVAPFLEAFAKKLGEALGESTTAALRRLTAVRGRKAVAVQAELPEHTKVTFVLEPDTPDEARLALLDLDATAPELRGATLHWNAERNQWQPGESADPEQQ